MPERSECPRLPWKKQEDDSQIMGLPRTAVLGCSECNYFFQRGSDGKILKDENGHPVKCYAYYGADRTNIHGNESQVDQQITIPMEGSKNTSLFGRIFGRK